MTPQHLSLPAFQCHGPHGPSVRTGAGRRVGRVAAAHHVCMLLVDSRTCTMATTASGLPGAPTGPGSALPRCPPLFHGRHIAGTARGGPGKLNGEMTGWLGCGVHGTAKPCRLPCHVSMQNTKATKKALWGRPRLFDLAGLTDRGNLALPKAPGSAHGELKVRQNTQLKAKQG